VATLPQIRIINLLGDRKDAESAATLGKIGGKEAMKFLVKARAKGDEDLRLAATDAYLQCAEDLADAAGTDADQGIN